MTSQLIVLQPCSATLIFMGNTHLVFLLASAKMGRKGSNAQNLHPGCPQMRLGSV
ncbi:hypothetical protein REPUB_Repub06bG0010100 [Reevesia pubescens]